jgi:hypothetical protein
MLGVGVANELSNLQNAILRVKTHFLVRLFISLESFEAYMFKMASHCPFEHVKHMLCPKERSGVKLPV